MSPERDRQLTELQERIRAGEYRVEPRKVADAILRRLSGGRPHIELEEAGPQDGEDIRLRTNARSPRRAPDGR